MQSSRIVVMTLVSGNSALCPFAANHEQNRRESLRIIVANDRASWRDSVHAGLNTVPLGEWLQKIVANYCNNYISRQFQYITWRLQVAGRCGILQLSVANRCEYSREQEACSVSLCDPRRMVVVDRCNRSLRMAIANGFTWSLCGHFGVALGSLWGRFRVTFESLWHHFGVTLGVTLGSHRNEHGPQLQANRLRMSRCAR